MKTSSLQQSTAARYEHLAANINYVNVQELKAFCETHGIPFAICYETDGGRVVRTGDADRKAILLKRILAYAKSGKVGAPTVFSRAVVCFAKHARSPEASDKVFYGQYKNNDAAVLQLMKRLTAGQFQFGAIAQEVIRSMWTHGTAPTYRAFADAWLKARTAHATPNSEWAYLADLSSGKADSQWKLKRARNAQAALGALEEMVSRFKHP